MYLLTIFSIVSSHGQYIQHELSTGYIEALGRRSDRRVDNDSHSIARVQLRFLPIGHQRTSTNQSNRDHRNSRLDCYREGSLLKFKRPSLSDSSPWSAPRCSQTFDQSMVRVDVLLYPDLRIVTVSM
jgi:hypothetical protein